MRMALAFVACQTYLQRELDNSSRQLRKMRRLKADVQKHPL
jgi:hypothetical protein